MDPTNSDLFNLAQKRLTYLAERQNVLASNIANANTPRFRSADLQPFASVLQRLAPVEPARTEPGHMAGTIPAVVAASVADPMTGRSIDGNTVQIDQQLTKVADTEAAQNLVTTIWKKYVGMFNTALGRSA